jgi:hypothetical protein
LQNFCKIALKVFGVEGVIRLELVYQESFQFFKCGCSDQAPLQAAPSQNLPLRPHHVGYKHFLDNIGRLYRGADTAEKLLISGGVFTLKDLWLTE